MWNSTKMNAAFLRNLQEFGNKVRYLKYDSSTTKNIYGESKRKTYATPIEFDAIVRFEPSAKELEEYGMTKDKVEVMVKLLTAQVEDNSLVVSLDDVIEVDGITLFITELGSAGRIGDKPLFRHIGCKKVSDNRGI